MYTVMRKGYGGLDDDMCCDGEYKYMETEKEAQLLAIKLEKSFGTKCSDLHPWKGSKFYVQEVTNTYINNMLSKNFIS